MSGKLSEQDKQKPKADARGIVGPGGEIDDIVGPEEMAELNAKVGIKPSPDQAAVDEALQKSRDSGKTAELSNFYRAARQARGLAPTGSDPGSKANPIPLEPALVDGSLLEGGGPPAGLEGIVPRNDPAPLLGDVASGDARKQMLLDLIQRLPARVQAMLAGDTIPDAAKPAAPPAAQGPSQLGMLLQKLAGAQQPR